VTPDAILRDIAEGIGITDRPVHKLLIELETTGYIKREKRGRRMHYTVNAEKNLRGEYVSDLTVRDLLRLVEGRKSS
jgi:predicted transcriptional regulator